MLQGPRFARVSYALFAVAVLAALLKIGGMSGAKPVLLQNTPPKPAIAETRAPLEKDIPTKPLLDLPEPGDEVAQSAPVESTRPERAPAGPGARPEARPEARGGFVDDLSVFRRPRKDGAPPEPVCGDLGDVPESSKAVFPLPRDYFDSYEPGWGSPRPQGAHEGTDLMSPVGTPEFAITDGTVVEVAGANGSGWNRLGGYTVMIRAAHDVGPIREGDLFYYAHLDGASALPVGTKVRAGQRVGSAGDTGEGPEVTRGKFPPHLHLGWYDAGEAGDRSKVESGAMDPYPLLLWLERNGGAVSGGTDASYCEAPQGPAPTPASPGETPDLDTGSNDARPTPATEKDDERNRDRPPNRDDEPANDEGDTDRPNDAPESDEAAPDSTPPPSEGGDGEDSEDEAPPPAPDEPGFEPPVQNEPGDADGPDPPEEAPREPPRVGEPEGPTIPGSENGDPDGTLPEEKNETGRGPSEERDRPDAEERDQPAPKAGQTDNRKQRLRP